MRNFAFNVELIAILPLVEELEAVNQKMHELMNERDMEQVLTAEVREAEAIRIGTFKVYF